MGNNLGTTAKIIFILSLFMIVLYASMGDISKKDQARATPMLDDKSVLLMNDLGIYYKNYSFNNSLQIQQQAVTNDSSFDGVDAFYRQNAEDKADVSELSSTIKSIYTFPSIFLRVFGIENQIILVGFATLVNSLIVFMLGLQTYKALRTGEVD